MRSISGVASSSIVSPFMDMDMRYDFRIVGPNERIVVAICASSAEERVLQAVLAGARRASHRSRACPRLPEDARHYPQGDGCHPLGGAQTVGEAHRLSPRPAPPERATTIVTETSAALD